MEAPSVTMTTSEVSGPRFEVMEHGEEFVPETPLSMELPARPYDVELGEEPPPSPVSETYYEAPELIEPTSPTTPQGGQSAQQRSAFENNVDQLREKEAQLQDVSAQLRALQSQLEKEQHRILELERQNEEERREHEEQQRTLVSQQADRALRLEGELNEAQRDLERASTETTQELHKTQAELEELKERESELTLELENLRSVETQRQREARELASDLSRLKAEYDQLLGQKRQMESDRNRADEENTRLEQWKSGAESQLARYSRGIRDFVSHSREKNS